MRFVLEYHNPNVITSSWVAEQVPDFLSNAIIVGDSKEAAQFFAELE